MAGATACYPARAPIEAVTPDGLRVGGKEYQFDAIVFATGFDAMTGALTRMGIVGRDGETETNPRGSAWRSEWQLSIVLVSASSGEIIPGPLL